MNIRTKRALIPACLIVAILLLPRLVASNYWLNLMNLSISFSIACIEP